MDPVENTQTKEIKQESFAMNKSRFMDQIKRLIPQITQSKTLTLKHLHNGLKIIFTDPQNSMKELQSITGQTFSMTFKQLQAKLHQFGFSINKRRTNNNDLLKISMRFGQPLLLEYQNAQIENQSSSSCNQDEQIADDFPKDEQIQQIMKSKEEKMKGFAKPNVILSKAQSDGMVGAFDKKRNFDDNSLEFKLFQQDLFSTPLAINRKSMSSHRQFEGQQKQQSRERSNLFKENYEKCSKLIDSTMIEILTAHRSKKIGDKADELLGKVIEIYDILSDNIENVNEVVMQYEGKGGEKKEGQINSPGFKPLNGLNGNMK